MEDFIEFDYNEAGLYIAKPKQSFGFANVRESVKAYDIGNASIEQLEAETNCNVFEVTGSTSSSRTFAMYLNSTTKLGNKMYKVVFSVVAKSGGPYTVTFTTGISGRQTVVVPVVASADTLTSVKYMMFDLYVDSNGNVSSSGWNISGSNSNGYYIMFDGGTMEEWGESGTATINSGPAGGYYYHTYTGTFPVAFIAVPVFVPTKSRKTSGSIGACYQSGPPTVTAWSAEATSQASSETASVHWYAIGKWK